MESHINRKNSFENNIEPYILKNEINNFSSQRNLKMRPPRDAYLFIPNEFQIIEENKDKPSKSLRRIFEGKTEYKQFEKIKLSELYQEIYKRNSKEKAYSNNIINISLLKKWDVLRLLQATCFDIDKSIKLILAHLNWRNEKIPNYVLKEKAMEILEKGFIYIHGRDCQYRPIIVVNALTFMKIKDNYRFEDLENFIIFFMKYLIENTIIPGQIENWNIITDVRGVSLYSLPSDFKNLMTVLSSNYRCRLFVNYIFGMSTVLNILWKIIQVFLDETSRKKVRFIKDSNKNEIFTYINKSQIEKKYGGDAEDKEREFFPGFMPSGNNLLDDCNRTNFLITEEKYKFLCDEGKLATVNYDIIKEYEEKLNKKREDPKLIFNEDDLNYRSKYFSDLKQEISTKGTYNFNILKYSGTNNDLYLKEEDNCTIKDENKMHTHNIKKENSFNLFSPNTSFEKKETMFTVSKKNEYNQEFFKLISEVKSEFCEGKCKIF